MLNFAYCDPDRTLAHLPQSEVIRIFFEHIFGVIRIYRFLNLPILSASPEEVLRVPRKSLCSEDQPS